MTLKVQKDENGQFTDKLEPEVSKFIKRTLKEKKIKTVEDAKSNPVVQRYIEECIAKANRQAISQVAQIKRWCILDTEFDVSTGELTPTFKMKRRFVVKKYCSQIDSLYEVPKL